MTPSLPQGLVGPLLRVERAKKHINDLHSVLNAFNDSGPYGIGTKKDTLRKQLVYYVTKVTSPSSDAATVAGDALQNLRSALDHLAHRLVEVGVGGPPPRPRDIAYPIAKNLGAYSDMRAGKLKGARKEAIDAINKTEPYFGGKGEVLWRLNELNNIDKHRLLITVGSYFRSVDIGGVMSRQMAKTWADNFPDRPAPPPFRSSSGPLTACALSR